jgi:hypothetical protein
VKRRIFVTLRLSTPVIGAALAKDPDTKARERVAATVRALDYAFAMASM